MFIDRLLLRYYHLKIPFDFTNQEEVQNLFNILEQSCIRKLGEAEYYAINAEQIALNENEDIKNLFNFYLQDNNTNILFKILSLAITTQNLGFIRLLRRENFVKNVNRNKQFKDK
ncbi:MAG TPA: hypothetical protein VE944_21470 [Nostoc sp.]|uniref:hypothetical protein n=1 Tax=Nostoc sp. TaxID=1180 RepID=UPI002D6D82C4|nr:hypothetical protein [Nostoc sp.]HYX16870.1 hypothetical protein [Nostoc sp.]